MTDAILISIVALLISAAVFALDWVQRGWRQMSDDERQ